MKTHYDPKQIEENCQKLWEANSKNSKSNKESFTICLPPPNVTGSLHMGHAFQDTLMDILIRLNHMLDKNTLWQIGTDHAGIATQMVVARNLAEDGVNYKDLNREDFVDRVWEWKEKSGDKILSQMQRLGIAANWENNRFTMDNQYSEQVLEVFTKLYDEGLIYRGEKLVNWDPILKTAVSDLEVISSEESGYLWYFNYSIVDSDEVITIATTRPETIFGDSAIAVNPEDTRFSHLIGQEAIIPIAERKIKIIADNYVDSEFGTGCVKITPAHDFNDYQIGVRHNLDKINIFTEEAKLNENTPIKFQGLTKDEARKLVVETLDKHNKLVKTEPHTMKVPRGDRTKAIIEPYLTSQWFVSVESLAKPAIDVVKNKEIIFTPSSWENVYLRWMENIEDWCISRQLMWGHRIPAWYDDKGNIYVAKNEQEVREKYSIDPDVVLKQDNDVLDTWFSSALWPFATLGWNEDEERLNKHFPTDVLVTGFDIIFFWVARMIMFSLKFTKKIPFKNVYIHGLIQDGNGEKMSKSKGNVLDPIDIIDGITQPQLVAKRTKNMMQPQIKDKITKNTKKEFPDGIESFGADSLRFSFCAMASGNRHLRLSMNNISGYRNFCNKIWNAARYIQHVLPEKFQASSDNDLMFSVSSKWILTLWQQTKEKYLNHLQNYRFDLAAKSIYNFIWNEYCDWFVEFNKIVNKEQGYSPEEKNANLHTLINVFAEILAAIHPIMPFISEQLWQTMQNYIGKEDILINSKFPIRNKLLEFEDEFNQVELIKSIIFSIRNARSQMNIKPSMKIKVYCETSNDNIISTINSNQHLIVNIARLSDYEVVTKKPEVKTYSIVLEQIIIHIALEGIINLDEERQRLNQESIKISQEITKCEKKLQNPAYKEKAPKDVVKKEENRLSDLQDKKQMIQKIISGLN